MLDYIFFQNTVVRQIGHYEILVEGTFSSTSDHLPGLCSIQVHENPHINLKAYLTTPSWNKIDSETKRLYQDILDERLSALITSSGDEIDNIDAFCSDFESTLETAKMCIPSSNDNSHTKPYWNSDVKQAHKHERAMRQLWLLEGQPRGMTHPSYAAYKKAKRDFRNTQTLAYTKYIEKTYDDINMAAECDIRLFWKLVKRQKPRQSKTLTEIHYQTISTKLLKLLQTVLLTTLNNYTRLLRVHH